MSTPTVTELPRLQSAVEHDTFADDLEPVGHFYPVPRGSVGFQTGTFVRIGESGRKRSITGAS